MSIGIVNDDDFNREFGSISVISPIVKEHASVGRNGARAVPEIIREVIAESAISGAPIAEVSKAFGVSTASVSAYKNGAHSTATYHEPNEKLKKHTDEIREKIGSIAKSKLLSALSHITEENLAQTKPRDLAGIAKDMSSVVNNISPTGPSIQQNAQFIFHTYTNKSENDYEVIDVVDSR